jgi:hypothetical protein
MKKSEMENFVFRLTDVKKNNNNKHLKLLLKKERKIIIIILNLRKINIIFFSNLKANSSIKLR